MSARLRTLVLALCAVNISFCLFLPLTYSYASSACQQETPEEPRGFLEDVVDCIGSGSLTTSSCHQPPLLEFPASLALLPMCERMLHRSDSHRLIYEIQNVRI